MTILGFLVCYDNGTVHLMWKYDWLNVKRRFFSYSNNNDLQFMVFLLEKNIKQDEYFFIFCVQAIITGGLEL